MTVSLDLADIQGNILTAYGKLGFPKGRNILFHVDDTAAGRKFVTALLPKITTALRWPSTREKIPKTGHEIARPTVAVNIAFTFFGLRALGVPTRSLRGLPDEFIDGMAARAAILGDDQNGGLAQWDEVWQAEIAGGESPGRAHILVALNAQMTPNGAAHPDLDARTREIADLAQTIGGVRILPGNNRKDRPPQDFQELSALTTQAKDGTILPLPTEHFGFTDAIGDPVFDGQYPGRHERALQVGNGAVDGKGSWRPLTTGEFLLGYPDEAQEIAGAAMPFAFSRNGAFMAYRKLHQNVSAFRSFVQEQAQRFGVVSGTADPKAALETFKTKIVGRWSDGVPLALAPTFADWLSFNRRFPNVAAQADRHGWEARSKAIAEFAYGDDPEGLKCPVASHIRRVNTRDGMAPVPSAGSVLNNRRRILRRGLPYGASPDGVSDDDDHGIVMLVVCATLFRQFEFVQQQWINYGLDAHAGNDTCPLVGNHVVDGQSTKFVIPSDPKSGRGPFFVERLPQFVETRGGAYFFIPSMTALRMMGMGVVDPT